MDDHLPTALASIVGERHVLVDPDVKLAYEHDVTGRYSGSARLVVLPADARECAAVLVACARESAPVVAQGGNTGLVGGGVPRAGEVAGEVAAEVVLSTRRMAAIEEFDEHAGQLTVGAGVVLADAQAAAQRVGRELTLDHGARSGATVGGMAATDAGGSLAFRYGTMRRHVVGVEAVLADGRVVSRLSGLAKDNAGYRWHELLIGSEGTLAVLTKVRLQLAERAARSVSALFGVACFEDALRLLGALRTHAPSLRAADFFTAAGLELVCAERRLPLPLQSESPVYVIVECAGRGGLIEELSDAARAAGAGDAAGVGAAMGVVGASGMASTGDVAVADDTAGQARLWAYRDAHTDAIRARGVAHKLDVSVPLGRLAQFVDELEKLVVRQRAVAQLVLYGHLGDGNVHVNILGLDEPDFEIDAAVLGLAAAHGGTISAEHGIGVAKARWLGLVRTEAEIALMRSLKSAFDPAGVLAPGRVLAGVGGNSVGAGPPELEPK